MDFFIEKNNDQFIFFLSDWNPHPNNPVLVRCDIVSAELHREKICTRYNLYNALTVISYISACMSAFKRHF